MAKIIIKSEKNAPFGRIFHVRELFSRYVSPIIDHVMGCVVPHSAISAVRFLEPLRDTPSTSIVETWEGKASKVADG